MVLVRVVVLRRFLCAIPSTLGVPWVFCGVGRGARARRASRMGRPQALCARANTRLSPKKYLLRSIDGCHKVILSGDQGSLFCLFQTDKPVFPCVSCTAVPTPHGGVLHPLSAYSPKSTHAIMQDGRWTALQEAPCQVGCRRAAI
eukprot:gene25089-biopygen8991